MGRWGYQIFDNDFACDFVLGVVGGGGLVAIEGALDRLLSSGDRDLETWEADEGLAAADIVARLLGSFGQRDAYTAMIDAWVKGSPAAASTAMVEKARQAIRRILAEHDKYEHSEEFDEWEREVNALMERLRPFAPPPSP
jgi:hypothetical protein